MIFKRSAPELEGLTLKVRDHHYTFNTPAEFEFALAGRTCVPSAKIAALADVRDEDLLKEASDIKKAERRLADSLSSVLEDSSRINDVLKEIDLTLISNDNDWRTIISVLMAVPASYERYKKIALVKYMQYLVSRQEIVIDLHLHRQIHKDKESKHVDGAEGEAGLKETAILGHSTFKTACGEKAEYERLPKGETLELSLDPKEIFTFFVARHQCAIVMRDRLYFIDADGRETSLRSGKNIVGRDLAADIVMEAKMRDISRKHLVIESEGTEIVRVTDISSHGTWVHPRYLESAGV
jgi:hypothetical protein